MASADTMRRVTVFAAPALVAACEAAFGRHGGQDANEHIGGSGNALKSNVEQSSGQSLRFRLNETPLSIQQSTPDFVRLESPALVDIASMCLSKFKTSPEESKEARPDSAAEERPKTSQAQQQDMRESDSNDEPATSRRAVSVLPSWLHCEKYAELAAQFSTDLTQIKQILQDRDVPLPEDRFKANNAELMRFAFTMGLIEAETEKERQEAIQGTVNRITDAMHWLTHHSFSSDAELKRFEDLLYWDGVSASGHPVLVIKIGQATRECKGEALMVYAEAIITQVQRAMETKFSDEPGLPEQLIVITDCKGTSPLQGKSLLKAIKQIGLTLNKHYPGRLHRFYVVDLPRMLKWPVKAAIIAVGHPLTRQKVMLVSREDPVLEGAL